MLFNRLVASLIGVTAFTFTGLQGQGRGPGGPRPGGPGFGGPPLGGFARLADLTDDQRQQVQAILEEERASHDGPPAAVRLHRELEAEILADVPDEQKIESLRQQLAQAQADAIARQVAVQRKIVQILTPEQRTKARERLAEGPRRRQQG
jgi:Spy/CpxP family protein refolding chaperone